MTEIAVASVNIVFCCWSDIADRLIAPHLGKRQIAALK
jgi:hypothetical protein